MRCRIALATALLGLTFAHTAGSAEAWWNQKPETAKNCSSESGSYPPGTIVDTTITTRDASGKVVIKKVRYICGQDGKWHKVASRWQDPGLTAISVASVVYRATRTS